MGSRSFSGSFSWSQRGFRAVVRRFSYFRLLFRQLWLVKIGRGMEEACWLRQVRWQDWAQLVLVNLSCLKVGGGNGLSI